MMNTDEIAQLLTVAALARAADVDRRVVLRGIAQGWLVPDAFVECGEVRQPAFAPDKIMVVLRHALPPKRISLS